MLSRRSKRYMQPYGDDATRQIGVFQSWPTTGADRRLELRGHIRVPGDEDSTVNNFYGRDNNVTMPDVRGSGI